MHRKFGLLIGLAAMTAMLIPATSASAAGACGLSGTARISPGLTTTKRSFSFTFGGKLTGCAGTGSAKSGTLSGTGSGSGTCATTTGKGTASVRWNNGQTSGVTFSFTGVGNAVPVQGKVTSGLFAGQTVVAPIAFTKTTPAATACLSTGLTALNFAGEAVL